MDNDRWRLDLIGVGNLSRVHVNGVVAHTDKAVCTVLRDTSVENLASHIVRSSGCSATAQRPHHSAAESREERAAKVVA